MRKIKICNYLLRKLKTETICQQNENDEIERETEKNSPENEKERIKIPLRKKTFEWKKKTF
jgi:hypothetical protein